MTSATILERFSRMVQRSVPFDSSPSARLLRQGMWWGCLPVLVLLLAACATRAQVLAGIDVLERDDFSELEGQRVGLVVNQASLTRDPRRSTIDAFRSTERCRLVALFAPEHGIDGADLAGEHVGERYDARLALPVRSLYGATRRPTREMLRDIDVMVVDLQDIGSRSYTFLSTMIRVMEGCADAGVPVVILDRPNPIGGDVVDGPVLDTAYRSFIGILPIPYVHGMTMGELATMANSEGWLEGGRRCSVRVVQMRGWRRAMRWRETGLTWIQTSPHIPTPESAFGYAMTGLVGEFGVVNIGVGTTLPFELVGAPWLDDVALADRLNASAQPGVYFRPTAFKPFYAMSSGTLCRGVRALRLGERTAPFTTAVTILATLRDVAPDRVRYATLDSAKRQMITKVCGSPQILDRLVAGASAGEIVREWEEGLRRFIRLREEYLLYE